MNKLVAIFIIFFFTSCLILRKKKTEPNIVVSNNKFTIIDSATYFSLLNKGIRIGGTRCSDCKEKYRDDSIVIKYVRGKDFIYDTVDNTYHEPTNPLQIDSIKLRSGIKNR